MVSFTVAAARDRPRSPGIPTAPVAIVMAVAALATGLVPASVEAAEPADTAPPGASGAVGFRRDGTGNFPDATPPLHWSESRNVRWKAALPSWSHASPIVVAGRIFVTSEPNELLALDAADGRLLWRRAIRVLDAPLPAGEAESARALVEKAETLAVEKPDLVVERDRLKRLARGAAAPAGTSERLASLAARFEEIDRAVAAASRYLAPEVPYVGTAASTPVSDGKRVCAMFGNQVAACLDLDGKLLWARWLPSADRQMRGFHLGQAASPLISGGLLVLPMNRLQALSVADGHTAWEDTEPYRDFGTPFVVRRPGGDLVATPSGHLLRAADGAVVARGLASILYVGPVVSGPALFFIGTVDSLVEAHSRVEVFTLAAEDGPPTPAWRSELPVDEYTGTPLVLGDWILLSTRSSKVVVLEAATGRVVLRREFPNVGAMEPSPSRAGAFVYVTGENGVTVVLDAKPPFRERATNRLGPGLSSAWFEGRRAYFRTRDALYCIEESAPPARKGSPAVGR